MASYHDLLDAIARVRSITGDPDAWKTGLTGDDVAAALNPASPSAALGAVITKLAAAHPDVFLSGPPTGPSGPPPRVGEGAAAEAIRDAEGALSHQDTDAAHVDLQVVTAVLNAHAAHADGLTELTALQRDIEDTVRTRTDLDTPAGAREFQRYLIGRLRDIRNVVEHSSLDATSKASLAAALSALYAASTPSPQDRGPAAPPAGQSGTVASESEPRRPPTPQTVSAPVDSASPPQPVCPDPDVLTPMDPVDPMPSWMSWSDPPPSAPPVPAAPSPAPVAAPAPAMPLPAMAAPSWGGGPPGGAPFGAALPGISGMGSGQSRPLLADPPTVDLPRPADSSPADVVSDPKPEPDVADESAGDETAGAPPPPMIRPSWTFLTEIPSPRPARNWPRRSPQRSAAHRFPTPSASRASASPHPARRSSRRSIPLACLPATSGCSPTGTRWPSGTAKPFWTSRSSPWAA